MTKLQHMLGAVSLVASGALLVAFSSTENAAAQGGGSAPVHIVGPLPLPVAGSATVAGEVSVKNSLQQPLYVLNVSAPPRTPYQASKVFTFSNACSSNQCSIPFDAVPEGKRLVITHVSGSLTLNEPNFVRSISVANQTSDDISRPTKVFVPTSYEGTEAGGFAHRQFSEVTLLYVDGGKQPEVTFELTTLGGSSMQEVNLAGYFEEIPE